MNKLNLTKSHLRGARLLSSADAKRQLYIRSGITFSVYDTEENKLVFAFASSELALRLKELDYPEIQDISVIRFEPLLDDSNWPNKGLYFQLLCGKRLILYSDDNVSMEDCFQPIRGETHYLKSPSKLWGPSGNPYIDCILLTPRLVDVIEDMAEAGQQQQIVNTLWHEYVAAQLNIPVGEKLKITGEVMEFSAKSFRGLLVIFDLII